MKKLNIMAILLLSSTFALWSMKDGILDKRKHLEPSEKTEAADQVTESSRKKQRAEEDEDDTLPTFPMEILLMIINPKGQIEDLKDTIQSCNIEKVIPAFRNYNSLRYISRMFGEILPSLIPLLMSKLSLIQELFLKAAKNGKVEALKFICDNGFSFDNVDIEDLLISAIGYGQVPFCRYLIEKGLFKNVENAPLIFAIILQDKDAVEALIKEGNKEGMLFGKYTENMVAAAVGNLEIFKLFVSYKERGIYNIDGEDYLTNLKCASRNGHIKIVRILLKPQNKIGEKIEFDDFYNKQESLSLAVDYDQMDMVAFLLSNGASVNTQNLNDDDCPLIRACKKSNLEMVKFLLDQGADPDLNQYNEGCRPIDSALLVSCELGDIEIVRLLIERNAPIEISGHRNWSPLMMAIDQGYLEIVRFLVDNRADIKSHFFKGKTPLIEAVIAGHIDIVKFLVSQNVDINAADEQGNTALDWAFAEGHSEIAKYLEENGGLRKAELESASSIETELMVEDEDLF